MDIGDAHAFIKDEAVLLIHILDSGLQSHFQLMPFDVVDDPTGNRQGNTDNGKDSGLLKHGNQSQDETNDADDGAHHSDQRNQGQ